MGVPSRARAERVESARDGGSNASPEMRTGRVTQGIDRRV